MTNKFYHLHNFNNLPTSMLVHENTLCMLRYNCPLRLVRVFDTSSFKQRLASGVVLVNPSEEDLTYIRLLDVQYTLVTTSEHNKRLNSVYTYGVAYFKMNN